MGYDINIIRTKDYESYLRRDYIPITVEEWHNYVNSDKELELRDKLVTKNPQTGKEISIMGDFAVFKRSNFEIPFQISKRGTISCRFGDESLEKAIEIARKLEAKVYGDEGEEFI